MSVFNLVRSSLSIRLSRISRTRLSQAGSAQEGIPLVNLNLATRSMTNQTVVQTSLTLASMDQHRIQATRSLSMPRLANVEAVHSFNNYTQNVLDESDEMMKTCLTSSKSFATPEQFTIQEDSDADDFGEKSSKKSGRKFGIFLTGSALTGIASTFWTYGQLKQQQEELSDLDGQIDLGRVTKKSVIGLGKVLHAAETFSPDVKSVERDPVPGKSNSLPKPITASRRDRFNFIAEVVEETAPALVYIQIKNLNVKDFYTGDSMTMSNGSGFIVRSDGLILTNAHVVVNKPRSTVHVTLQDGRTFAGVVEDVDVGSDLATVRIPATGLPTMKLGKSSTLRPGEFVVAMGSPLSLTNTITTGVVSSVARNKSELHLKGKNVSEYIQTDAAITFGNSGGPLLNLDGEAIGINSMKLTPGISFAIPIDHAKEFLQKTEEVRRMKLNRKPRRYFGITMVALDGQVVEELRRRQQLAAFVHHGVLVFRMVQDSPADRAGIRPGDVITHIDGTKVSSTNDVYKVLESDAKAFDVTVVRGGRIAHIDVEIGS